MSLELDKTTLVYIIAMLELVVKKLKSNLNASSLENTDLQASVTGLKGRVQRMTKDMEWVLSTSIQKIVDKLFVELSFY